jgi:hypothetical protein
MGRNWLDIVTTHFVKFIYLLLFHLKANKKETNYLTRETFFILHAYKQSI